MHTNILKEKVLDSVNKSLHKLFLDAKNNFLIQDLLKIIELKFHNNIFQLRDTFEVVKRDYNNNTFYVYSRSKTFCYVQPPIPQGPS